LYPTYNALREGDLRAAYYEQKLAAESLEASINQVGVSAVTRFGVTAAAAQNITKNVEQAIGGFDLLNDQDLDQLRSALDSANAKLRQMQEETQSARERLAELNAELLEEQGQDQKAELLRQQLDYQQAIAEIEAQREEAALTGNRELLAILSQQESTLNQINRTKIANIQADSENQTSTDAATQRVSRLADETERAARAMSTLGSSSLATLSDQAGSLRQHLQSVNGLL
jgi:chromosome segregation ATPase